VTEIHNFDNFGHLIHAIVDQVGSFKSTLSNFLAKSFGCVFVDRSERRFANGADCFSKPLFPGKRIVD